MIALPFFEKILQQFKFMLIEPRQPTQTTLLNFHKIGGGVEFARDAALTLGTLAILEPLACEAVVFSNNALTSID